MKEDVSKRIELAVLEIEKTFGKGAIMRLSDKPLDIEVIPSSSINLNKALGVGGIPRGRMIEIYGQESCIEENTFLNFNVKTRQGKHQNTKGGNIKHLYNRFHKIPVKGQGFYQRPQTVDSEFYLASVNDVGRIFSNKIINVFETGIKEVFEIKTSLGHSIIASKNHKFMTLEGFYSLEYLNIGQNIFIHNNTPFTKTYGPRKSYQEIYVKNHPIAAKRIIKGQYVGVNKDYEYYRLRLSRAVMEANLNNLSLEEYTNRLNSNGIEGLIFLSRNKHVHHLDENIFNNNISNLMIIDSIEHGKIHAIERHNNLRFMIIQDKIISIKKIGEKNTYDIKMQAPYNNYIADNFVVHNSGKTTLSTNIMINAQRLIKDKSVAIIDSEHVYDINYAKAQGLDTENIRISQPSCAEEGLDITERLIASQGFSIIVIDSTAALVPQAELEQGFSDNSMALQGRLLSRATRKFVSLLSKTETTLIFISQMRANIDRFGHGPKSIPTGGNSIKFYASIRIKLAKKKQLQKTEGSDFNGILVEAKIDKNKVAPPYKVADMTILYGKGICVETEILDLAVEKEIVKKTGAFYELDGTKYRGTDAVLTYLMSNKEKLEELRNLL